LKDKSEPIPVPATPDAPVPARTEDDVIRIEDLAPRAEVSGGRKILLGEFLTPVSNPIIPPES
jgi:hypothetical protein